MQRKKAMCAGAENEREKGGKKFNDWKIAKIKATQRKDPKNINENKVIFRVSSQASSENARKKKQQRRSHSHRRSVLRSYGSFFIHCSRYCSFDYCCIWPEYCIHLHTIFFPVHSFDSVLICRYNSHLVCRCSSRCSPLKVFFFSCC